MRADYAERCDQQPCVAADSDATTEQGEQTRCKEEPQSHSVHPFLKTRVLERGTALSVA